MDRKKIVKYGLITVSFGLLIILYDYMSYQEDGGGSFADFVDTLKFGKIIFLSILGLLAFMLKGGLSDKYKE